LCCVVFIAFVLCHVSKCCMCFWIAHCWLSLCFLCYM
jgi:hypothetical protein